MHAMHSQRVVSLLNGMFWGVYVFFVTCGDLFELRGLRQLCVYGYSRRL